MFHRRLCRCRNGHKKSRPGGAAFFLLSYGLVVQRAYFFFGSLSLITIFLLQKSNEFFSSPFNSIQFVGRQFAPFLLGFPFHLFPLSL